jgi:hypothetical protein
MHLNSHAMCLRVASLLTACPVSLTAAGGVYVFQHAVSGLATLFCMLRLAHAYTQAGLLRPSTKARKENWSPINSLLGTIWGLWIAGYAKYSPDLWGSSCWVSASTVWRGVDSLLLRGTCNGNVCDGNIGHGSLRTAFWGTQWGQLNQLHTLSVSLAPLELQFGGASAPSRLVILALFGGSASVRFVDWLKIVTWLILPVVICLSQRLSHACLSISNYTVKLRMAH